ncbi:hypothetical protein WISP_75792 [Willisornis vidua]|uniref:Uncharacterized protein n=1 Tax=Willisornis vidua TaxID=1566151 RepID=A0ABQ9DC36_9PASS|nr:hypothetical protein WISP_75792 [Willisornis vidua]
MRSGLGMGLSTCQLQEWGHMEEKPRPGGAGTSHGSCHGIAPGTSHGPWYGIAAGTSHGSWYGIGAGTSHGSCHGISAGTSHGSCHGIVAGTSHGSWHGVSAGTSHGSWYGIAAGTSHGFWHGIMEWVGLEGSSKPIHAMGRDTSHCPRLLQALSKLALDTSRAPRALDTCASVVGGRSSPGFIPDLVPGHSKPSQAQTHHEYTRDRFCCSNRSTTGAGGTPRQGFA